MQKKQQQGYKDDDRIFYAALNTQNCDFMTGEAYCEMQRIGVSDMLLIKIIELGLETHINPDHISTEIRKADDYDVALGRTKEEAIEQLRAPLMAKRQLLQAKIQAIEKIVLAIDRAN